MARGRGSVARRVARPARARVAVPPAVGVARGRGGRAVGVAPAGRGAVGAGVVVGRAARRPALVAVTRGPGPAAGRVGGRVALASTWGDRQISDQGCSTQEREHRTRDRGTTLFSSLG